MSNRMAERVLNLAWRQVDRDNNQGFIFAADLPYLISAIDGILKKTLLNDAGKTIIKDFSRNDPSRRIYKDGFALLFDSLVGVSFESAIDTIGLNEVGGNSRGSNRRFNSRADPFSDDSIGADIPDFKKEYKKYEKLSGIKDDEILYRDRIIENLEKSQSVLEKNDNKIKELKIKNDSLEQEVLYRDNVILSKQNEIESQLDKISSLESKITNLQKELNIYKASTTSSVVNEDERTKFNKELLQKVKDQQEIIKSLKKALAEKKEIIVTRPVYIPSRVSSKSLAAIPLPEFLKLFQYPLFNILFMMILLTLLVKYSHFSWKDMIIERMINNNDIDYDYYNLGEMESDFR